MRTRSWQGLVLLGLLSIFVTSSGLAVAGEPLSLTNSAPRWVEVRFEDSPGSAPGALDESWGAPRRAYFEPDPRGGWIRIRIPGQELESQLRAAGSEPVAGTFSEFVWTLDQRSGHVLTAEVSGRLRERFRVGFFNSSTDVEIRVEMTTVSPAGFMPAHQLFGQWMHAFCGAESKDGDCTLVEPRLFDPERGYVNAVGSLVVESGIADIRTFSPLGEVRFSEIAPESALDGEESTASGRSSHETVCSPAIIGSCPPGVRGES